MRGPILIIDDESDIRGLLTVALGFIDADVTGVSTPSEAIAYMELRALPNAHPPRIILCDLALKNSVDGWALTRQIRSIERKNKLQPSAIAIVTAYSEKTTDPVMAVMSDVDTIIEKPIDDWGEFRAKLKEAYVKRFPEPAPATLKAQAGVLRFTPKEAICSIVVLLWMAVTLVEMTLNWNQKSQIIKNEEQIISSQRLEILRINDTREDVASWGMLNKNGPYGRKEEKSDVK